MSGLYAQILDEEVKNVIVCDSYAMANELAKGIYGPTAFSVECSYYAVGIGCKYIGGVFYNSDGITPCERIMSTDEKAEHGYKVSKVNRSLITAIVMEALSYMDTSTVALTTDNYLFRYYADLYRAEETLDVVPNIGNLRALILANPL